MVDFYLFAFFVVVYIQQFCKRKRRGQIKQQNSRLEVIEIGTVFMPRRKLSNRSRWILNSAPSGTVNIDDGALRAIEKHKSLLPSGVVAVKGTFEAGAVVMLNDKAKAVTSLSSSQLKSLIGRHSTEIRKLLGPGHRDVVAIPEDIVLIEY